MAFENLIIRARSVTKSYGSEIVLSDFNLDVWNGSIVGILGISGSGKTTALRLLAGFDKPDSGIIEMRNRVISSEDTFLPPEERNVGMVFQDYALFPHLNVEKNISFGLSRDEIKSGRLDEVIEMCNLNDYSTKLPQELSGGQQQRVALARAIAPNPEVILLDEPFTGVDVKTEEQIISLLKDLKKEGHIMLVSTHNLGSVPEFCDRTVLVKGTVISHGLTEDVFTNLNLEKAFGGVLRRFTLGGSDLHDDSDQREVTILTDDERPFVQYGEPKKSVTKRNKIND